MINGGSSNTISQGITIEGLKCILECTVCLCTPTSTPVHRCNNGHIICHVCRPKLSKEKCPVCRIELGNLRCLTSEKIISDMPIDCQFQTRGCMMKLPKEPMKLHEIECSFSMVNCSDIVVTCEIKVPLLQLSHHIIKEHRILSKYINQHTFSGMVVELQQGVRGNNSRSWKWEINNDLHKACHFSKRGCEVELPRTCLNIHEIDCEHSILKCSNLVHGCDISIPIFRLRRHIQNKHGELLDIQYGNTYSGMEHRVKVCDEFVWTWNSKSLKSLIFNGQMFFMSSFKQQNIVHFWVYILETDEVAKRYMSEITLTPIEGEQEILFRGHCVHSIFNSKESVVSNRVHLSASLPAIDLLTGGSSSHKKQLRYRFILSKISERSKTAQYP